MRWTARLPYCLLLFAAIRAKVNYVHLGCFKDQNHALLSGSHINLQENATVERCVGYCTKHEYRYSGLHEWQHCRCGNGRYDTYGPADSCSYSCSGNNSQKCGGATSTDVYEIRQSREAAESEDSNGCSIGVPIGLAVAAVVCATVIGVYVLCKRMRSNPTQSFGDVPVADGEPCQETQALTNTDNMTHSNKPDMSSYPAPAHQHCVDNSQPRTCTESALPGADKEELVYSLADPINDDLVVVDNDLYGT